MILRRDGYELSDELERVDIDLTWRFLRTAYWSPNVPRPVVERALAGSTILGLYAPDGSQAGLARAVTDAATFAWIADTFVVAALVILITGWEYADPLVSALIGVLVLASSWSIIRDSVTILLEASPRGINVEEVGKAMASAPGVVEVHDLHVWTITSGFPALAAHVIVGRESDCHAKRRDLEAMLAERFGLEHTTIQVDHEGGELLQIEGADPSTASPERS